MKNLMYLSYGMGQHVQEVIFSLLSALCWLQGERADFRLLVCTDLPLVFQALKVETERLEERQLDEWAGPHRFHHRRKILALRHILRKYPAPTVLIDGDTYFSRSPIELFRRIAPGHSVMHIMEGRLREAPGWQYRELADLLSRDDFTDPAGRPWRIDPNSAMWNSGVVGIDPADEPLLDEVLDLTDSLYARLPMHTAEQFAFSHVLSQRTRLRHAADIVFHYWLSYLRDPFRRELPQLMSRFGHLSEDQRARRLYAHRPRPSWLRRRKLVVKRALQHIGCCRDRGVRSNG